MQWYVYVPGAENVNWYDAPSGRGSDENATEEPASEPIWWVVPSWFVQVTIVPGLIVRTSGVKAKFLTRTRDDPVIAPCAGAWL